MIDLASQNRDRALRLAAMNLQMRKEDEEEKARQVRRKLSSEQIGGARAMLRMDQTKLADLFAVTFSPLFAFSTAWITTSSGIEGAASS